MNKKDIIDYLTSVAEYSLYPEYTDERDVQMKRVKLANYNYMRDVITWLENDTDSIALDQIDFYIKHNEKLGKKGIAGAFRELETDIENAIKFKELEIKTWQTIMKR